MKDFVILVAAVVMALTPVTGSAARVVVAVGKTVHLQPAL